MDGIHLWYLLLAISLLARQTWVEYVNVWFTILSCILVLSSLSTELANGNVS